MHKTIFEIEKEYIIELIKFFCREYSNIPRKRINESDSYASSRHRDELTALLSKQIENRLLNTNLIVDYKVEVVLYPKFERRDVVIDNVLEDTDVDVVNKIIVLIQHRDRTMVSYEHLIVD